MPGVRIPAAYVRLGIVNLADRTETGAFVQVLDQAINGLASPVHTVRMHSDPCIDERTDQPSPHRALVVRGVASAELSEVPGPVVGVIRGQ